jgi:hypothetical protein
LLSTSYRILSNILLSRLTPYADEIIRDYVDFDVIDQRLIRFAVSGRYWNNHASVVVQCISDVEISRKPKIQLGGN